MTFTRLQQLLTLIIMTHNPRLKRLLFFEPEPGARDSEIPTVNRVVTRLIRAENRRRLSPNEDPAVGRHAIDVSVCLLGRRGLCFCLSGESLQRALITKPYFCGGTRHEHLPIHVTVDPGVSIIDLSNRLESFQSSLDGPFTLELRKWSTENWSSTTYLPSGGSFARSLETLPLQWRSFRWKRRRDRSWYRQRIAWRVSM